MFFLTRDWIRVLYQGNYLDLIWDNRSAPVLDPHLHQGGSDLDSLSLTCWIRICIFPSGRIRINLFYRGRFQICFPCRSDPHLHSAQRSGSEYCPRFGSGSTTGITPRRPCRRLMMPYHRIDISYFYIDSIEAMVLY